jgi:uncharacterized membrane protein
MVAVELVVGKLPWLRCKMTMTMMIKINHQWASKALRRRKKDQVMKKLVMQLLKVKIKVSNLNLKK